MADLYEYGVAVHLYKPIIKRAVVDFAVGADWTPAAGDVKISKDGGAAANVTNLPTAITMGNTAMWDYSLTATEMQAAKIRITVADSATKAVEDTFFEIDTYGNASAQHKVNLNDAVRAGLTALPNAAAEAAGGLYTRGSGAGQIAQSTNGQIDVDAKKINSVATSSVTTVNANIGQTQPVNFTGTGASALVKGDTVDWAGAAVAAVNVSGVPKVDVVDWLGSAPNALVTGRVDASVGAMAAGVIAAATFAANALDAVWSTATRTLTAFGFSVTVGTNNDKTGYALTTGERDAVADALLDRNMATGTDSGSTTIRTVRQALRFLRNKWSISGGTLTVTKEDDTTASHTAAVSTTAGDPVSSVDPAGP